MDISDLYQQQFGGSSTKRQIEEQISLHLYPSQAYRGEDGVLRLRVDALDLPVPIADSERKIYYLASKGE